MASIGLLKMGTWTIKELHYTRLEVAILGINSLSNSRERVIMRADVVGVCY